MVQCPDDVACVGGQCACPGGQSWCNEGSYNYCADTNRDPFNCGSCGSYVSRVTPPAAIGRSSVDESLGRLVGQSTEPLTLVQRHLPERRLRRVRWRPDRLRRRILRQHLERQQKLRSVLQ